MSVPETLVLRLPSDEDEIAELHRIANMPGDDIRALVTAANIDPGEFEQFVGEMGLEEDETCRRILNILRRPANSYSRSMTSAQMARATVQERVYGVLRHRVMCGGFEPGRKLKVAELASALGTSAMPVREALLRLAAERAIQWTSKHDVRVPSLSRESLRDLTEARLAVEGLAIARAATNMDEATLAKLNDLIVQSDTETGHVLEGSVEWNHEFYFAIYRRSGSAILLPIIESLWLQAGPYLRLASEHFDERGDRGATIHAQIVAALVKGDAASARKELESDIRRSLDPFTTDNSFRSEHGGVA